MSCERKVKKGSRMRIGQNVREEGSKERRRNKTRKREECNMRGRLRREVG